MEFKLVTDNAGLNDALFRVTHGLYIVTTRVKERLNGQCIDALMQVTNAPPRISIGMGKRSLTYEMIGASGRFVVSALNREDPACGDLIRRFGFQSGRDADKLDGLAYELTEQGIPFLPNAVAIYECSVLPDLTTNLGTHSLFVASVDQAGTREGGEPLTYNEYRKRLRKGG